MLRRLVERPTADQLRIVRGVLVGLTAAVMVSGFVTQDSTYSAAASVRDRSSQALLEITAARASLVEAHAAVVRSFRTGNVELSGPGGEYLGQVSRASQSLARVAELNVAGEPASRTLGVTSTLLSSFSGAIGQADAQNRSMNRTLALADLSYASRLMHQQDGVLAQIDALAQLQREVLQQEVDGGAIRAVAVVLWCFTTLVLLCAFVAVQVWMARRFRRRINPALLAATVAVALCGVAVALTIGSIVGLHRTASAVDTHRAGSAVRSAFDDFAARRELTTLIQQDCGQVCGETVAESSRLESPTASPPPAVSDPADTARTATNLSSAAANSVGMLVWVPGLLVLVGVLVVVALQSRVDEYRFRRS